MIIQLVKILFLVLGSLSMVRNQPSFSANVVTKQYSKLSPFSIVQIQSQAIAFLIDIFGGILTLDLSDPTNPQTLADFTSYQNTSVQVADVLLINSTLLIIELYFANALMYNISNPLYIKQTFEDIQIQIDQMLLVDEGWHLLVISNGNLTIYDLNDLYKPIDTGINLVYNYTIGGKGALNLQQQLLFISNSTNILIYNISDLNNLTFISDYATANMTAIQKLVVHPTQNLLFCMDYYDPIISINYTNVVWPTDQINCNVNYSQCVAAQQFFQVQSQSYDLQLSTDGKSLLSTNIYYGLCQLDIKTLQIIQIVPSKFYNSQFLQMQGYILLCDQFQLQIISVITFEYSNNFPNLYNSLLIESQSYYFYPSQFIDVFIREEQNQVWLVDQRYGIFVFDVSSGIENIQIISKQKQLTSIDSIAFSPTDNDLVFCLRSQANGYMVLNFSNIQSPQMVSQTDQISSYGLVLMKKQNAMISVDALSQDLIIYDISNFSQPTLISQFNILDGNYYTYVQLIQNESIVVICIPNQKFEIWSIANLYNPFYLSQRGNRFIYNIIISRDGNTIYIAAGYLGIQIFDIKDPTVPELISIYQDGSQIVGIYDSGTQFQCIQVSDPTNIIQFGQFNQLTIPNFAQQINQINNISVVQWDGELQFISVGNNKVIGVELFIKFQNSSTLAFQQEAKPLERGIFVGEIAQLMLTVFGDLYANTVKTVQISTSTGLQALPNWITFQENSQLLTISAVKEREGLLIFIISVYSQVLNTDFKFVDKNISKAIYVDLQNIGYIDQNGFIINTINLEDDLIFSQSSLQQYSEKTMNVLINKIYAIPQQIYIISSLYFYPSSPDMVISSNSTQVIFQISTNVQNGQFMYVQLNGITVSFSNNQDTIILSGQIQQINNQVHNIRFNSWNLLSQIQCQITIQDNLNYPYTNNNYTMNQLTFIKQNFKPQLNSPLQAQFNKQYPNSKIYITDQFTFVFSSNTFIDKDDVDTYTVQILENGNWIPLDSSFWIIFSSQGMSFQGTPTESMWNQEFTIKVIATDGYAECSDTFTLKCSLVPFDLVVSYIVAIGGPLATAFGVIQYRAQIYNVWMRKKKKQSKQIIRIGESKLFQYLFVGEKLEEANTILSKIEQKLKKSYTKFVKLSKQELFKMMGVEEQTKIQKDHLLKQIILNIYYQRLMKNSVLHKLVYEHLPRKKNIDGKSFYTTQNWWKKYTEIIWKHDEFLPKIRIDNVKLAKKIRKIIKTQTFKNDLIQINKSNSNINTEDIQVVENSNSQVNQIQLDQTSNLDLAFLQKNESQQSQTNKLDISIFEQCIRWEALTSYTINSDIKELFAVKIFRKIHFTKCSCLMKLVELDLQPLEMDGNKPLPDWIQMKKLENTLIINVTPLEFDTGIYVFRILENGLYLLSEFEVEIVRSERTLLYNSLHQSQKNFGQTELQQAYKSQNKMQRTQNNYQQQDNSDSDSENQLTDNNLDLKRKFMTQLVNSKRKKGKKVADIELQQINDPKLEPKQSQEQMSEKAFEILL